MILEQEDYIDRVLPDHLLHIANYQRLNKQEANHHMKTDTNEQLR